MKLAHKLVPEGLLTGTPPPSMTGAKSREPVPAMQRHFSPADIDKVEIYLDSALQDKSIGSKFFPLRLFISFEHQVIQGERQKSCHSPISFPLPVQYKGGSIISLKFISFNCILTIFPKNPMKLEKVWFALEDARKMSL